MKDKPNFNDVKFFVGKEVEHTVAQGEETLFVAGWQPVEEILSRACDLLEVKKYQTIIIGKNNNSHRKIGSLKNISSVILQFFNQFKVINYPVLNFYSIAIIFCIKYR